MNTPPDIRRATAGDIGALAALLDDYRVFYGRPRAEAEGRRFLEARFEAGDSAIYLATCAGQAAGFTQLYPGYSTTMLSRIWILNDLFVSPPFRRRGVASALMHAAEEFARSTGAVRLSLVTGRDNHAAQALYSGRGWQPDTTFKTYSFETSPAIQ